jgi:hypothetical protein
LSFREVHSRPSRDLPDWSENDQERAYALLEEARLRCEQYMAGRHTDADRVSLREIHRELGLAGWQAGTELDVNRRLALLDGARQRSTTAMFHPAQSSHALVAAAIIAEDALADTQWNEHLHLARLHLLCAMGLLASHL